MMIKFLLALLVYDVLKMVFTAVLKAFLSTKKWYKETASKTFSERIEELKQQKAEVDK